MTPRKSATPSLLGQMARAVTPPERGARPRPWWDILWAGVRAQPWGIAVALVATYTGMVLAVDTATVGALISVIALLVHGLTISFPQLPTDWHPDVSWSVPASPYAQGVTQSLQVVTLPAAALAGAVGGFAFFYASPFFGGAGEGGAVIMNLIAALITGAFLSLVLTTVLIMGERTLWLPLRGYRVMSYQERTRLAPLLRKAGAALGIDTALPEIMMSDQRRANAWTHCTVIVLTTGLLRTFPADAAGSKALAGVLAHELYHWRRGHAVGQSLLWASAWPLALLYNASLWLWRVGWAGRISALAVVAYVFIWPVWVLTTLVIAPVQARCSRRHEYEADGHVGAAGPDYRDGLREALITLSAFEAGRTGWESVLAAAHPPTALRLDQLTPAEGETGHDVS